MQGCSEQSEHPCSDCYSRNLVPDKQGKLHWTLSIFSFAHAFLFFSQGSTNIVLTNINLSLRKTWVCPRPFTVNIFFPPKENHILEDVNKCVIALQEGDVDTLDRTAGAIRGRAARVVHIINAEMENYEPGVYTERVLESIKLLSETG